MQPRGEAGDAWLEVDRRMHESHERVTTLIAAEVKDASHRVGRLAGSVTIETHAKRLQPMDRLRTCRGQHRHRVRIAQPGACGEGVDGVQPRRVLRQHSGGDTALSSLG